MKNKHMMAYMETAKVFANCSVGVRLKVGTVIVKNNNIISVGYNALPKHIDGLLEDENGKTKPEVRHSEKNALMALTKSNQSSIGSTLFCTHAPCRLCAIDIVDAGIVKVIYESDYRDKDGIDYLANANIEVYQINIGKL
jgi:dCMP deaminase